MNEYGKLIDKSTLQFVRILPGPIERIWEYLVDDSKRGQWFAGGPTDLSEGGEMKLVFNNSQLGSPSQETPDKYKEFGDGYESIAIVKESKAPTLLVINWENGIVKFELNDLEDGNVKLTLTHEKLSENFDERVGVFAGWHTHLNILQHLANGSDAPGFWGVHMGLEDEYQSNGIISN